MKPSRLVLGLFVVVLVVATVGVAFPPTVPDDYGSSAAASDEPVEVEGGEIAANQTALWGWTQRALDRDVDATPTVVIRDFGIGTANATAATTESTAFQRLLVLDDPDEQPPGGVLAFVTALSTDVNVNEERLPAVRNGTSGRTVEGLLVHEFTHVAQFQTPAFATNQLSVFSTTTDEIRAYRAMVEGGAEFVADDYTNDSAVERLRAFWTDPATSAAERLGQWPYYRGLVYLDQRLEEPSDVWSIYRDRPQTTATILRGDAPGDGPPNRRLSLDREGYDTVVSDRPGAALAEVALTKEIDPERARDVAAGWQWGSLRSIRSDAERATGDGAIDEELTGGESLRHVWVTEWRDEGAADAFETAMTEYLDGRWSSENGTWKAEDGPSFALERVDDGSLALLVGPDAFLGETTVTVEGDEYAIGSDDGGPNASAASVTGASAGPPDESTGVGRTRAGA